MYRGTRSLERKEIQFYLPFPLTFYAQATFTRSLHPWHGSELCWSILCHCSLLPILSIISCLQAFPNICLCLSSSGSPSHLVSTPKSFNFLLSKPSFPPPFLQDNFFQPPLWRSQRPQMSHFGATNVSYFSRSFSNLVQCKVSLLMAGGMELDKF